MCTESDTTKEDRIRDKLCFKFGLVSDWIGQKIIYHYRCTINQILFIEIGTTTVHLLEKNREEDLQ